DLSPEELARTYLGDSSLRLMIDRLSQIQEEQLKIRHAWSTHDFHSPFPVSLPKGVPLSADDVTNTRQGPGSQHQRFPDIATAATSPQPIVFTKAAATTNNNRGGEEREGEDDEDEEEEFPPPPTMTTT
ncbi:hypothetical protein Ahia01_001175200, partial [Argonauta hians]